MDEADVLGDRIAIMAEGRLRTVGSSFFLKKKFGTGYKLICVKEPACDTNLILDVLREYAPDTKIESDAQTETIFIINEIHLPIFQNIFKHLEDDASRLKISSFGCNLSTLEEVFLKLGTDSFDAEEDNHNDNVTPSGSTTISCNDLTGSRKVTGTNLMLYQVEAMMIKKFHYMRRNYRSALFLALFSIWIIVALMSAPTVHFNSVQSREISFSSYEDTTTTIENDDTMSSLVKDYQNLFDPNGKDKTVIATKDMMSYILEKSNESLPTVNQKYLIGATLKPDIITAWFNGQPFHTMPLTLNTINRALLKHFASKDHDISLVNKPFLWSDDEDYVKIGQGISEIVAPLIILYLLLIHWPSVFIGFYIKERESRAKLLQFISGANRFVYWVTSFLFDYAIFFIIMCALLGGIGAYQRQHLSTAGELGTFLLIFAFYGFATLPLIYAFSYLFSKHSTGESMVSVGGLLRKFQDLYYVKEPCIQFFLFVVAVLFGVYAILKYLLEREIWKILANIIYWVGLMIGPFSLFDCFIVIGKSTLNPSGKVLLTLG